MPHLSSYYYYYSRSRVKILLKAKSLTVQLGDVGRTSIHFAHLPSSLNYFVSLDPALPFFLPQYQAPLAYRTFGMFGFYSLNVLHVVCIIVHQLIDRLI